MNVLVALIHVIATQLVTTLVGVTPALATLDTRAMDFLAHVSTSIYDKCLFFVSFSLMIVSLNGGGCHQGCQN